MNANEFVALWRRERDILVACFLDDSSEAAIAQQVRTLKLSEDQAAAVRNIISEVVRDTMYTLLLGLDGEASIGGVQQRYIIHDENGAAISESGEIEGAAYEQFHGEGEKKKA